MITKNGWVDNTGDLNDYYRIKYFHDHLDQVLDAILSADCNIKADIS